MAQIETTSRLLDLNTMDMVDVVKVNPNYVEPADMPAALAMVDGDNAKLFGYILAGLKEEAQRNLREDVNIPWQIRDDNDNLTPASGKYADESAREKIGALQLTLAKTTFATIYNGGSTDVEKTEARRAAKAAALKLIKDNPAILGGIVS